MEGLQLRRWVLGRDTLLIHGMSPASLDIKKLQLHGITDVTLQDLGGNAVVAHCYTAVLVSVVKNWPHSRGKRGLKRQSSEPSMDNVDEDAIMKAIDQIGCADDNDSQI